MSRLLFLLFIPTLLRAAQPAPVEVRLESVTQADRSLGLRYSPPARRVTLAPLSGSKLPGFNHLSGRLPIGPEGFRFVVSRSAVGECFDTLYLDADNSGALPATGVTVKAKTSRGKFQTWFNPTLQLKIKPRNGQAMSDEIPTQLYITVETEDEVPEFIRMRIQSFRLGSANLAGTQATVLVRDSYMDGKFDARDWWELVDAGSKSERPRKISNFAWSGGRAWKIKVLDPVATRVRIVPHDPGITQAIDAIKRDPYYQDKQAPKATSPIKFRKDVNKALQEVAAKKAPYFIKFETEWCGPCKMMTAYVFNRKSVVVAAKGLTCIKVDGDERKDLVEEHQVSAYPTGILFDAEGKELRRYRGYRGVEAMTKFLKR